MDSRGFSLTQLLHELINSDQHIARWQDLEQLVVTCCMKQDPKAKHNIDTDPDVMLSNGIGIEAKSTTSMKRSINLNSAAPDPNTFYVVAYHNKEKIKNVAIVSGQNFYCPEIRVIKQTNTGLRPLSNKNLQYRTRIMWQMRSPFMIWQVGNFIVDSCGKITVA